VTPAFPLGPNGVAPGSGICGFLLFAIGRFHQSTVSECKGSWGNGSRHRHRNSTSARIGRLRSPRLSPEIGVDILHMRGIRLDPVDESCLLSLSPPVSVPQGKANAASRTIRLFRAPTHPAQLLWELKQPARPTGSEGAVCRSPFPDGRNGPVSNRFSMPDPTTSPRHGS